jgi:hypothetical protein
MLSPCGKIFFFTFLPLALILGSALPLPADSGPLCDDPAPLRLEVVEQWPGGLVVDLVLNGMAAAPATLQQEAFHRLTIPGAGRLAAEGWPELPAVGRYVAVPHGAVVEVEVLHGVESRVPGLRPLPHQPPAIDDQDDLAPATAAPDPAVYGGRTVYPARRVEVETPRDIHGCRVVLLKLYPVRYDPADRSLLYTSRMRVRLLFRGGNGRFIDPRHRSPAFDAFFRALLLNPESQGRPPVNQGQPPPECEMLIITPAVFRDEALRLAHWKNRRGIPTLVRTTAEIGNTAEVIAGWIEERYHTDWPELSYLLFFGDVGENDSVPCHYRTDHDRDGIKVGTDLYYGVVDVAVGEQDYFPDLFMGRIPVNSVEEAATVVDKIIGYEQAPDTGGWLDSVLLAAYHQLSRYFVETSEAIHDHLSQEGFSCNTQYEVSGDSLTGEVIQAINEGVLLVTHRDHGQDRNWGDQHTGWIHPEFTEEHVPQLVNGSRLPVMLSVNCRSGWFDGETDGHSGSSAQSFCEELLRLEGGGVVGVVGDTRTSYSGYNDELIKGMIDAIWDQFDPDYPTLAHVNPLLSTPLYQMGAVLNFGKYWMYDKYIIPEDNGYPDNEFWWPTPLRNRIQFEVYHYFGDPSMEIWTGTPADGLVVSHNQQAFIGDTEFTVNVNLDGALVAVARDGVLIGRAVSDGGQTTVQFTDPLEQPGQLTICVTRHDQLPFLDSPVDVVPPDGPWVLYQAHQVDDTPAGGNGDGLVSPGETVDVYLAMHNFGTTTAQAVTVSLDSKSGLVDLLEGQQVYPAIGPGESAVNVQPFSFRVFTDCPDGELIRFTVNATDGASIWESGFFVEVDGAHITHYSHQVLDNLPGGGNQNYIADPGELFDLRVSLRNIGQVYASQVTAQLSTTHPLVEIRAGESGFPNMAAGNIGTSYSPHFRLVLDESIPCGISIPFTIDVSAAEGQSSTGLHLLVGGREAVFADNMESGTGDWTGELVEGVGDWEIVEGEPPGNPGHAWFSTGEALVKDNRLESPYFQVTNGGVLRFRHRVVMEPGNDGCVLEISTDGGGNWTDLGPWITYGGYTHELSVYSGNPLGGRTAWSGTSGPSLTRVEVDLNDFAGTLSRLRFRMGCDESIELPGDGWAIDDLEVEGVLCTPWMSPDETISMNMTCTPVSATLPFTVAVQALIHNDSPRVRRVAATLDLQLAGGYYMANLTNGTKVIGSGQTYPWGISRIFPGHPMLVGVNTFRVSAYDITEYPYNQPPDYPASGDTAVDTCDVECLIP